MGLVKVLKKRYNLALRMFISTCSLNISQVQADHSPNNHTQVYLMLHAVSSCQKHDQFGNVYPKPDISGRHNTKK